MPISGLIFFKMENEKTLHQGEILMLLVKRSRISNEEVSKNMNIARGYLSDSFRRPVLSKKMIKSASEFFGVDESVFQTGLYPGIPEDSRVEEPDPELEELKADVERLERFLPPGRCSCIQRLNSALNVLLIPS